jgi:hypothetical protein
MAIALGEDPCNKLNNTNYPTLWLVKDAASDATNFTATAVTGATRSFGQVLSSLTGTAPLGNTLLRTPSSDTRSSFRLLRFMANGVTTNLTTGTKDNTLNAFLLKRGTTVETILDNYVISGGISKTNYTRPLTDAEILTLRNALLDAGYLLKSEEIYNQTQLTATDLTQYANQETLLLLNKVEQSATLSAAQSGRKLSLQERNLRFYAAFLAEYCFYRTRYQWLLEKYFSVYTNTSYTPITISSTQGPGVLFQTSAGKATNQYSETPLKQTDYLMGLAHHMAIINSRMVDLRRLLNSINSYYSEVFTNIQANINSAGVPGSNSDVQQTISALQLSARESKKYLEEAQFREGVMKYTQEKNRYSNILLGLYAILNVSALAMIYKLK